MCFLWFLSAPFATNKRPNPAHQSDATLFAGWHPREDYRSVYLLASLLANNEAAPHPVGLMYVAAFMREDERELLSETERDVLRDRRGHPDFGEVQPAGFFKTDLELLLKVGKLCGQVGGVKIAGTRHVDSWSSESYRAVLIHSANEPIS